METVINKLPEDINYMFYIKPKGAKRFSAYNPGQGTMGTGRVFTELYRKEHLQKVCDWIAEDMSGDWIYQLRSGDGKKIYWQHDPTQPATPAETPRISTETVETVNVSAEGENIENEPIKYISEIMETCRTWDNEKRDYTDEYKYYTWLANHIPEHKATNKNTTELILEEVRGRISAAATLAAHGVPKCDIEGAVCAVVNRLAKMEDILQFNNRTEPSQPSETPQTIKRTTGTPKPRETAWKPQNRGIGGKRTTRRDTLRNTLRSATSVPRKRSTTDAAYW